MNNPGITAYLRTYWLDYRRRRFQALVAIGIYALIGFLVLPWAVERIATDTLREDYDRVLEIGEFRTNPFTFSVEIVDLSLADTDGEQLAGFDRLFIDFSLASAINRAWTFESIHLDGPVVREERFADGATRLARLAEAFAGAPGEGSAATEGADAAAADAEAGAGLPALLVHDLRVRGGAFHLVDRVPGETVEIDVRPIRATFRDLDTRPGKQGTSSLSVALAGGGALDWEGEFELAPLQSRGTVELDGLLAKRFVPYLRAATGIRDLELVLGGRFAYTAGMSDSGFELTLSDIAARVDDLRMTGFDPAREVFAVERIAIEGGEYRYRDNRLHLSSLQVEGPALHARLDPQGRPDLLDLLPGGDPAAAPKADPPGPAAGEPAAGGAAPAPVPPFDLALDRLRVAGLEVDVEDRGTRPPAALGLRDGTIEVDDFRLAEGTVFPARVSARLAGGGRLAFDGDLRIAPDLRLEGDLEVDALALAVADPYLQQQARLAFADGHLSTRGRLRITPEEPLGYAGRLSIGELDLVEQGTDASILSWASLDMESLEIALGERRLETSVVSLRQPFGRVAIAEDRTTNIGRLMVESESAPREPAEPAGEAEAPASAFDVAVDGIEVEGGALAFSDRSLPLPFSTRIHDMNGRISTLASTSAEPAQVELEGQVDDYGLARIGGAINTWQPTRETDIRMEFRNLQMPDYSPYAVPFAGRRIASGRMDLDLAYRIDAQQLQGSNQVVLHDLRLGEPVPHPDATALPLGLAIALLKDSEGVIDIDLTVRGDVGDPAFDIGSVVRQALVGLLKRAVSSPFNLLASLVGADAEALRRIEFLPGRSDLTPPQRERIRKLVGALAARPQLAVELPGVFAPEVDRQALQRQSALRVLRERMAESGADVEQVRLSDKAARETLRALFAEYYPDVDPGEARARFEGDGAEAAEEGGFDVVAYHAWLAEQVVAAQSVADDQLAALAAARAETVRSAMTKADGAQAVDETGAALAPERVRLLEPRAVEAGEDGRVALEPGLTAAE